MKNLIIAFILIVAGQNCISQTKPGILYLENTVSGKIKKINLDRSIYLELNIDSFYNANSGGLTYTSYETSKNNFTQDSIFFSFTDFQSWNDVYVGDNNYVNENFCYLANDSTVNVPYSFENGDVNLYLTNQTKFRAITYGVGLTIFSAALFNSFIVAPLISMNNGSFSGYNWNRFKKFELYSLIGFGFSIPVCVLSLERDYHFQTNGSYYPIYRFSSFEKK